MTYKATVHPKRWATKLLVTDPDNDEILRAVLPTPPNHPRALLTLLEGLALWSGSPLDAAICVAADSDLSLVADPFDDAIAIGGSALVRLIVVDDVVRRGRRLTGIGDFRQLRMLHGRRA
jgi:hypothetical protein